MGFQKPSHHALGVLEAFAHAGHVSFDRIEASRALGEMERAIPGDDCDTWCQRLIEVGESLNLRVRTVECSLRDVLTFVQQGIPVAACLEEGDGEASGIRWILVDSSKGRRVRLANVGRDDNGHWLTVRQLGTAIGLESLKTSRRWIIGQPAMSCDPGFLDTNLSAGDRPMKPFARLLGLIRPERNDLWAILVFAMVVGLLALATPIAVEALVNTVAFGRYLQPVVVLSLLLFTFLAFAAAVRGLITYMVEIIQRRLFVRVIEDLAYRLPRAEHRAFDQDHGPELVNRFFDVVTIQKVAATLLLDGVALVLTTVIGMMVLAFYHPFLLGFDVVLLALIAFTVFVLGRGAVNTAVKESKAKYAVAAWLEELARHHTAFKLHSGAQFALDRADQLAVTWLDRRKKHFRILMRQILFALGLQAVAATVLLGLGGWLVITGELTLGQLVAAELIVMMIVGSFAKLGKYLESFYDLLASVDKVGKLFDLQTEPHNKLYHLRDTDAADVNVRDVSFHYASGKILSDFDLRLKPRESVALTGPSGSGKSTVIDLLCGLRAPDSGHIELDGIDLRELRPDSLREHLAAARSVEIFDGTIDENVHLNRPEISPLDVREALSTVGLLDEVLWLPDGLNTRLLTHGSPLSSGQALRLMIARAIVGRPRLLLIDGTLDGLDDESLTTVLGRLMADDAPWTLLVATGRKSVIDACQRVVSLGLPAMNSAS
jgi:ABC-type bacteriocin/lantibiotic exporter with double-glycine peptidase domain